MKRLKRSLKWMGRHYNWVVIALVLGVGIIHGVKGEPVSLGIFWIWLGILILARLELMMKDSIIEKLLRERISIIEKHIDFLRGKLGV